MVTRFPLEGLARRIRRNGYEITANPFKRPGRRKGLPALEREGSRVSRRIVWLLAIVWIPGSFGSRVTRRIVWIRSNQPGTRGLGTEYPSRNARTLHRDRLCRCNSVNPVPKTSNSNPCSTKWLPGTSNPLPSNRALDRYANFYLTKAIHSLKLPTELQRRNRPMQA